MELLPTPELPMSRILTILSLCIGMEVQLSFAITEFAHDFINMSDQP